MLLEILSSQSHHYQKCHQPDVSINHLGIRECLTSDCRKRHIVPAHPCKKFLFHNHFVLVVRHKRTPASRDSNPTSPIGNVALLRGLAFRGHTSTRPVLTTLKDCRCSVLLPCQDSNLRPSGTDVQRPDALPTELHGIPYIFIRSEAHAGAKPCLRYLVIR